MSEQQPDREVAAESQAPATAGGGIEPLPGEPGIPNVGTPRRSKPSMKGLLALGLVVLALIAVTAYSFHSYFSPGPPSEPAELRRAADRPSAAAGEPRKIDLALPAASQHQRIPALIPEAEDVAEPIGVRRTGQGVPTATAGAGNGTRPISPEDGPVMLVASRSTPGQRPGSESGLRTGPSSADPADSDAPNDEPDPLRVTKRNLQAYQQQLQGMLETLTRSAALSTASGGATGSGLAPTGAAALPSTLSAPPSSGLFGGQLQGSATPRTSAVQLGNRSLTLPKGTAFTCALKTRIISATSGFVGCQVQRNLFSDDGRVLLVERGSHLDGEYRITSVRPGTVRIPVLWTRIRTPLGVTVDLESPGTGQLGESGVDGHVDSRWGERIGAAMLLSLIDDSVKLVIQNQADRDSGSTIVLPSTTANTSKLAEKVLDSTINIPPLIYQNQGGIVGIYVARDVDFSSVYALRAVSP